jgi:glycosyltransferase involved in cell wall biosynthesis
MNTVAVVIPCFKVKNHILRVLENIGPKVAAIYVVDDACPEKTGELVQQLAQDNRVRVLFHGENQGVGGAVITGYRAALEDGHTVLVKIDGDGQMDPALIEQFVDPIISGEADYTKGNRFFNLENIRSMPKIRLIGNSLLSFVTKISSGYWDIFDPANGYTAIHRDVARRLPFHKISKRYFFESDMMFRLNTMKAVVVDIPMDAKYGEEISNLKISHIIGEFTVKHCKNFVKRILYGYYLRDMSLASIELPIGAVLFFGGMLFGIYNWINYSRLGLASPGGTVMIAGISVLLGLQLILAFLAFDISSVPRRAIHGR